MWIACLCSPRLALTGLIVPEPKSNEFAWSQSNLEFASNPETGRLMDGQTCLQTVLVFTVQLSSTFLGQTVELAPSILSMALGSVKTALCDLGPWDSGILKQQLPET